jgi:hypothetical protein
MNKAGMESHMHALNKSSLSHVERNDRNLVLPGRQTVEMLFGLESCFQSVHPVDLYQNGKVITTVNVATRVIPSEGQGMYIDFRYKCNKKDMGLWEDLELAWINNDRRLWDFWKQIIGFASYYSGLNHVIESMDNYAHRMQDQTFVVCNEEMLVNEDQVTPQLIISFSMRTDRMAFYAIEIPYAIFKRVKEN